MVEESRVVMGAMIAMMASRIPGANKGTGGRWGPHLQRGKYTWEDAMKSSRAMLEYVETLDKERDSREG